MQKMVLRLVSYRKRIFQVIFHGVTVDQSVFKSSRFFVSYSSPSNFSYIFETETNSLGKLNHKDWLAPNEVLKIFKTLRDPELVIQAFKTLSERKDYKPNEALYSLIINRFANARKFDAIEGLLERIKIERCRLSNEFFYRLIKIYGNVASNPDRAIKTLFRMPEFNCWPSVKTFNFVLNMLVCAKQFDVIHEVYLSAPRLGVTHDTCCFNILIKGLCQCNKLDAAFAVFRELSKQGCKPNATTYSTLMHGLCRCNKVNEAFELCEKMERDGCHPDTVTFNILISGLCKQGRVAEAMTLLDEMKLKGCYPNSGSYQALLYGLLSSEKFVEAKDFIDRMLSEDKYPSFLSYKLTIEGLCKENLLSDVSVVLKQMVHRGFVPRMGTWKMILESIISGKISYNSLTYDLLIKSRN